ncbi:MAG: response regulator, partial [Bacteroidaceae bacterium]|nr:response regulator [Bacteroidaceae bacterium]
MLLRMQLSKMGYNVVSCEDSVQVHTICLIEKPDLILQDVQMPKMSGFDVARALKSDPKTADIPIIFLTAYADKEHTLEGFASGGSDYVAKPFEKEVLIARLNAQLKLTSA